MSHRIAAAPKPTLRFVALLLCYTLLASPVSTGTPSYSSTTPSRNATRRAQTAVPQRTGELLVRFSKRATETERHRLVESRGAQSRRTLRGTSDVEIISFPADRDIDGLIAELRFQPEVEVAEPNYIISADQQPTTPNDPRFAEQWALKNTEGNTGDIQASSAWEQTTGSPETIIAVIDSGIDFSHADLQRNRWTNAQERLNGTDDDRNGLADDITGWDYVQDTSEIADEHGHGTAVAGIIAAEGHNEIGIAGVMWRASLMDLRVLDRDAQGDIAKAIEAIDYATAHGAQVINLSWSTSGASTFLRDAILRAGRRGVIVVCSAGNSGESLDITPRYPANYDLPNLLSVAATDSTDGIASTSNWSASHVTVGAPGVNILTTRKGGGYQTLSGTSAASAVVSGIVGLVRTQRPHLRAGSTREAIANGVRQLDGLAGKVGTAGVVSAIGALGILYSLSPSSDLEPGQEDEEIPAEGLRQEGNQSTVSSVNNGNDSSPGEQRGNPQPGPPAPGLPNLDDIKNMQPRVPKAPNAIPSTKRGLRHAKKDRKNKDNGNGAQPEPTPTATPTATPTTPTPVATPAPTATPTATPTAPPVASDSRSFKVTTVLNPGRGDQRLLASVWNSTPYLYDTLFGVPERTLSDSPFSIFGSVIASDSWQPLMNTASVMTTALTPPPLAPSGLAATAASAGSQVNLSWLPASGAAFYRIERRQSVGEAFTTIANTTNTSYTDTTTPSTTSGKAYLYQVRTVDAAGYVSPSSNLRLVTAMAFTDADLGGSGMTTIKAQHFAELRSAVGAVRATANLGAASWTDAQLVGVMIKAVHMQELRARLGEALSALGLTAPAYTDANLGGGYMVKRAHISELRQAVNGSGMGGSSGAPPANETVWVEDGRPTGATPCTAVSDSSCDGENWTSGTPSPFSGSSAQYSATRAGAHQYYFYGASDRLTLGIGDKLFAYVYIHPDATNPVKEVMLQFNAGLESDSWQHRVYWGEDRILWGESTIRSRVRAGDLPQTGQWVRLEVPAATLGLEGQTLHGMAFTVFDGRATWDRAGKISASSEGGGTGLTGSYYGSSVQQPFTDLRLTRTDPTVNFNWASAPATNMPANDFTVRWTGQIEPRFSETYTFYTRSDDGVQLWVNNQLVVDNWTVHASTENSGQINLFAGWRYDIRMEFFDGTNSAISQLSWSSANQPKQIIPQSQLYPAITTPPPTTEVETAIARLDAANSTGGSDLFSGNYAWSLPLVSLPGRAGMNLGLSLAYNSLVWTKAGNAIVYDADNGYPSPGFRLGFPTIQPSFFNTQTSKSTYMLITPSGGRVELRQTGTGNIYESVDSSYLQLTEYGASLLLRTTDGTQLTFTRMDGEYVCTQVKDANGNFLTVTYNADGDLKDVTDTLKRKLVFNYDSFGNLQSITQVMNSGTASQRTHEWATFGFGDAQTVTSSFTSLPTVGIGSGASIPVLRQVGLADGTLFKFEYNDYGQVNKTIRQTKNAQNVYTDRMYTAYTLASTGGDCPRVTERRDWAENWNGLNGVPAEALTTHTKIDEGTREVTLPDSTKYKEYFYTGGWGRGLSYKTETLDGSSVKKTTTTQWTQDNTSLSYPLNPRVYESAVEDSPTNGRRTTIDYTSYGLPVDIREYAKNGATPLRRTHIDYNIDPITHSEYLNRRIIGLVREQTVYREEAAELMSKVAYEYDQQGDFLVEQSSPVQHDAGYGAGYKWRGLVTTVRRWDTTSTGTSTDITKAVAVQTGYNTQGSVILTRGARTTSADVHKYETTISYVDDFEGTTSPPNTFAYPTQVSSPSDPIHYTSSSKYDYDTGQATSAKTPMPGTSDNDPGPVQTFTYDNANRLIGVGITGGASTSYDYSPAGDWVKQWTKVNADKPLEPDTYSTTVFDGAGRVRAMSGDLPGSTGGKRGQYTRYDVMGRVSGKSNPAEMDANWNPVGDDTGWVYTTQTYDWKGRPRVTTHTDNHTDNISRREVTYDGCGCAGGDVTTVTDEVGRQQQIKNDVFGRTVLVKDMNPVDAGGNRSVYRTTTNTYNVRDQITDVKVEAGVGTDGVACAVGTPCQKTTIKYDGHGRVQESKTPKQSAITLTEYNSDDSVMKVTDARNAAATYTYNNRGLVTGIAYNAPAGITPTPNVTFSYDAAGNRSSMTEAGLGSITYGYNTLSQPTSESRVYAGVGTFTLNYGYNNAGALKSISNSLDSSANVTYAHDYAGQLKDVNGGGYGGVTQYASNMRYRAWGAVKHLDYGNNPLQLNLEYDVRLQAKRMDVRPQSTIYNSANTTNTVMGWSYQYFKDSRLYYSSDLLNNMLDRKYGYDHTGRSIQGTSGKTAQGLGADRNDPYDQAMGTTCGTI
jgi:YD repeat-containing protein